MNQNLKPIDKWLKLWSNVWLSIFCIKGTVSSSSSSSFPSSFFCSFFFFFSFFFFTFLVIFVVVAVVLVAVVIHVAVYCLTYNGKIFEVGNSFWLVSVCLVTGPLMSVGVWLFWGKGVCLSKWRCSRKRETKTYVSEISREWVRSGWNRKENSRASFLQFHTQTQLQFVSASFFMVNRVNKRSRYRDQRIIVTYVHKQVNDQKNRYLILQEAQQNQTEKKDN